MEEGASRPGPKRPQCITMRSRPISLSPPLGAYFKATFRPTNPPPQPPPLPTTIMTTALDALKQTGTVVVSDSGDFECEHLSALA